MTSDRTSDTLTRGAVTYRLIETRDGTRLFDAGPNEPLPYAVFSGDTLVARCADRVTAGWIMDLLQED